MATYKGIKGVKVVTKTTDPTASEATGTVWYNSSGDALKYAIQGTAAWASATALPAATNNGAGFGIVTAAMNATGYTPGGATNNCQTFNGTAWTEVGNTTEAAPHYGRRGAGTLTAGVIWGGTTQTVDTALQTSVGSGVWTNDHKLLGVSYFAILLEANGENFGGQLPTITMVLEGKKILDISTLTDGDEIGDMTSGNYTSSADQNPADVLYDYLISSVFGKGLDRDETGTWIAGKYINLASFKQARIDAAAARSAAGYNLNGFLQTEKQLFDNVGEILETCNGMLLFVDGKYEFRIKKPNEEVGIPTSAIFDKDTIVGEIKLSLPNKARKLNKATGIFNNPDTKYNDDVTIYDNATYREEDNGSVLETQEDYTMITTKALVDDLIEQTVKISRNEYTLNFTAAHTALLLRSGDIIEVRHDEFGWGTGVGETQKFFRVQELKLTEDNTVEITATTYDSSEEL